MTKLSSFLSRELLHEDRVVLYILTGMSANILWEWGKDVQTNLENWSDTQPYLAVHDVSHPSVGMPFLFLSGRDIYSPDPSSNGRQRTTELLGTRPNLLIKIALVLSASVSGDLAKRHGRTIDTPRLQHKVFSNRASAIEWLLS
jgi:hypothetical protein